MQTAYNWAADKELKPRGVGFQGFRVLGLRVLGLTVLGLIRV